MALKIADRVKQRTNSTGTAGISLIGSIEGFQTFSSVLSSGDTAFYVIEEADKFEVGLGTFHSSSFARTVVFSSSNSGDRVNLGGSGIVSITYPADRAVYLNQDLHSVISSGLVFSNNDRIIATSGSLFYNNTDLISGTHDYASGIAVYASGQAITNKAGISYVSGIAVYASGQAVNVANNTNIATYASGNSLTNASNISTNSAGITYVSGVAIDVSGVANYASGQAVSNESDIVATSGIATDVSGVAYYSSGLLSGGSASGVVFYGGDNVLKSNASLVYNSGTGYLGVGTSPAHMLDVGGPINASGNGYKLLDQSIATYDAANSKLKLGDWNNEEYAVSIFAGGGTEYLTIKSDGDVGINQTNPNAQLDVTSDAASDIGMRIVAAPAQFRNLQEFQNSAGSVIAAVTSVGIMESASGIKLMASGIATTNSEALAITFDDSSFSVASELNGVGGSHRDVYVKRDVNYVLINSDGVVASPSLASSGILSSGVLIHSHVPSPTANRLYNDGGVLKFGSDTVITGGVTTYTSGIATYASGQAIENEADIVTASGALRTDVTSNTAIATYASGQAIENEADIVTASGALRSDVTSNTNIATYASGLLSGGVASGIAFYGSDNVLNSDTSLIYNSGTGYLGISTTPSVMFDVGGSINASGNGYKLLDQSIATYDAASSTLKLGDWNDEDYGVSIFAGGATEYLTIKTNGNVGVNQTNPLAQVDVQNDNATDMGMRIKAAASQSANLQEWQSYAGSMLAGLTSVGAFENVNGVKVYAAGIGTGDVSRLSTTYSGSDYYIESETLGTGSHKNIYIKRESGYLQVTPSGVVANPSLSASGVLVSGVLFYDHVPTSTTNRLYNDGGTLKFNGVGVGGVDAYTSGVATYASGQAIENEGDILALQSASGIATSLLAVSGTATSLIATSGIASYASGNTSNISFGSNAEGDILYHNGTKFIRLAKGTNNYILKMNGNVPNWEAESGGGDVTTAELQYVSGIAVYSSGQAIENEGGILALQSASGIATSLLVASGSATYASGQAIANETDIVTASGALRTDVTSNTNIATYASGQVLSLGVASGLANYASGNTSNISFGSNAEGDILYHNGSKFIRLAKGTDDYILKMNGNVPNWEAESGGGGDVTTAQLQYVSGIAVYSSGQAIANESDILALQSASGIATSLLAVSGTATSLVASSGIATYSSGQAISNQTNIATNVTNITYVSGVAASLVASSGIATYASGQAIANETDIVTASGALRTDVTSNTNIATYGSGQVLSLQVASGAANYASGNTANISFGSNAEGDILYNNGTKFIRLAKGTDNHVLTMDGNVPNWEAAAGGGSPGGSDTQIQFNDSSSFGGDGDLTWNKTTNVLTINGTLMAGIKSFVIDHPTKEDMKLQYSCLEGPENGVYVRGAVEGNVIDLPDYWVGLVDESSITVQLTANGYSQPGLFVDRIQDNKVYLISEQRINAYYIVHATRKDVEPLEVEWPK